jgi:hypothetical protein
MAISATNVTPRSRAGSGRLRTRVTEGYRYARGTLFIFLAAAVDVFNVLDRGSSKRYLILLVPIMVVVLIRGRRRSLVVRRSNSTDKIVFAIWLMGMIGTLYDISIKGGEATARPLFFPMTLAFLYLFVVESPTDEESAKLLRAITNVGVLYIGLAVIVNIGLVPHLAAYKQFKNAGFAYVMIGIAGAVLLRRWWLLAPLLVLEAINFVAYPSATSILCTIATLITFFMTKPRGSRTRPYVVAIIALLLTMVALANISTVAQITGDYFNVVGKTNANNGRLDIWATGFQQWQQSPFVGQVFAGGTVAQAYRTTNGQLLQLPFHNDYVLFLAEGGVLGLGLLLSFVIGLNIKLGRAHRIFVAQRRLERANLLRTIMVGFNSFFLAAAFNPVLEGMSRSAVIFSLYGLAMLVCSDEVGSARAKQSRDGRRSAHPSIDEDLKGRQRER